MKRLVSYIYRYSNGVKKENIGFGKIDTNDNQLKINISLRYNIDSEYLEVYFFVRGAENTKLIFVGNAEVHNANYELRKVMDISEATKEKYNAKDIWGILIKDHKDIRCISFWKEEYRIESYIEWDKVSIQNVPSKSEANSNESDSIEVVEEDTIYMIDKNCIPVKEKNYDGEIKRSCIDGEEEKENKGREEHLYPSLSEFFKPENITERTIDNKSLKVCVITPKDIYALPRQYWCTGKNAYSCHGFVRYGKLFLIENDGIYIGVPGYKTINDEIVAIKYGFNRFMESEIECLKRSSNSRWTRGLWCKKIM